MPASARTASNVPARSRGTGSRTSPISLRTVLAELPLRSLSLPVGGVWPRSYPRWSAISASNAACPPGSPAPAHPVRPTTPLRRGPARAAPQRSSHPNPRPQTPTASPVSARRRPLLTLMILSDQDDVPACRITASPTKSRTLPRRRGGVWPGWRRVLCMAVFQLDSSQPRTASTRRLSSGSLCRSSLVKMLAM
jgi:hypothetical protein